MTQRFQKSKEQTELDRRFLEYPLEYFWISLQSKLGRGCSYLEAFFENQRPVIGSYTGTGCVVGEPGRALRDQSALLKRLEKHKRKRLSISLTISSSGYHYRTESGLRILILRGTKGWLFEGDQKIGCAEGPSAIWLQLSPKSTEIEDEERKPRVVNWK